jgi:glycosyltransferase involved in cell wall biosynthesis
LAARQEKNIAMNNQARNGKLALCIPAYNAEKFLSRLLTSAQQQKIPFDEIWLYNDCSTDGTAELAARFGAQVISGEKNIGCSGGKNRLMHETSCEWIHFHDADDDLKPNFTTLAKKWMAKPNAPDVVLFNYESRRYEDDGLLMLRDFDAAALQKDPARYAIRHQINPYCGLYRREALLRVGGYDEDLAVLYNEDCRFHMRLAFAGLSFDVEPEYALINLERQGSMSGANKEKCARARLAVLQKAAQETSPNLHREIGLEAWLNARHLGAFKAWEAMGDAIDLAKNMGVAIPEEDKAVVRALAWLAPKLGFKLRAQWVARRDGQ